MNQVFYLDLDDTNLSSLTFTGNTVSGASTSHFKASSTTAIVTGNTFNGCGTINPQGCKFENNTINDTTATTSTGSVYIDATATSLVMKNLIFNGYSVNSRYAVYVPAGVTSITMDNWQFDDPNNTSGYAVYWAGTDGTLTISATNGTNLTTAGCTSAGGTVTVSQQR